MATSTPPRAIGLLAYVEQPSMGWLRSRDGERLEVVLVRSINGTTERQRASLRTLGLGKRREGRTVVLNSAAARGQLHQLRHLLAVRLIVGEDPLPGPRQSHRPTGRGQEREELIMASYIASGGNSALVTLPSGWAVRAEAHEDSFALVWPARADLDDVVGWLRSQRAEADVVLGLAGKEPLEPAWDDFLALRTDELASAVFARVDTDHLALTWASTLRQIPERSHGGGDAHELGIGASVFDEQLLGDLLRRTAVDDVAQATDRLLAEVREVLRVVSSGTVQLSA